MVVTPTTTHTILKCLPLQVPAVVGMVKTDQSDHVQVISDWPVSLLNCHLPGNGLAKVNMAQCNA